MRSNVLKLKAISPNTDQVQGGSIQGIHTRRNRPSYGPSQSCDPPTWRFSVPVSGQQERK